MQINEELKEDSTRVDNQPNSSSVFSFAEEIALPVQLRYGVRICVRTTHAAEATAAYVRPFPFACSGIVISYYHYYFKAHIYWLVHICTGHARVQEDAYR